MFLFVSIPKPPKIEIGALQFQGVSHADVDGRGISSTWIAHTVVSNPNRFLINVPDALLAVHYLKCPQTPIATCRIASFSVEPYAARPLRWEIKVPIYKSTSSIEQMLHDCASTGHIKLRLMVQIHPVFGFWQVQDVSADFEKDVNCNGIVSDESLAMLMADLKEFNMQ